MHDDITRMSLEWLYKELKKIKVSLGHLESRSGCDKCRERQDLERKQGVVEHLIDMATKDNLLEAALRDLKEADALNCDYCRHQKLEAAWCDTADFDCKKCNADCVCKTCKGNAKWEWRGPQKEVSPDD